MRNSKQHLPEHGPEGFQDAQAAGNASSPRGDGRADAELYMEVKL